MDKASINEAHQIIQKSQNILVISHIRPDGDAIGSVLGLGIALQSTGKNVQMILEDGVPRSFRHLVSSDQIQKRAKDEVDCSIVVDCSDLSRTGELFSDGSQPDINIDHHNTNLSFARVNLVDSQAAATAEILSQLLREWNLPIEIPAAEALLTGIITDTLGFRVASMSPNTLRVAASLFEIGANLPVLYDKALLTRSFRAARYWGFGLSSLQLEDRLLWTQLTLEDRQAANYPGRDDADLINILQTVEDADIFVIFIEQSNDSVKVSWRARSGYDVSQVALQFGGGGHKPAAGAEIQGSIDEVVAEVLTATRPLLNGNSPSHS
jgi:bifunctional oligoribonuclease and PAP phosphatase NrnA